MALEGAKQALQRCMHELEVEKEKNLSLHAEKKALASKCEVLSVNSMKDDDNDRISKLQNELLLVQKQTVELELQLQQQKVINSETEQKLLLKTEEIGKLQSFIEQLNENIRNQKEKIESVINNDNNKVGKPNSSDIFESEFVHKQFVSGVEQGFEMKNNMKVKRNSVADELQASKAEIDKLNELCSKIKIDCDRKLQIFEENNRRTCDKLAKEISLLTMQRDSRRQEAIEAKQKVADLELQLQKCELELAWKDEELESQLKFKKDHQENCVVENAYSLDDTLALQQRLSAIVIELELAKAEKKELLNAQVESKLEISSLQLKLDEAKKVIESERTSNSRKIALLQEQCNDLEDQVKAEKKLSLELPEGEKAEWQKRLDSMVKEMSEERERNIAEIATLRSKCLEMVQQATIADALAVSLTKSVTEKEALLEEHVKLLLNKNTELKQMKDNLDKIAEQKASLDLKLTECMHKIASYEIACSEMVNKDKELKQLRELVDKLMVEKCDAEQQLVECANKLACCEKELGAHQSRADGYCVQLSDMQEEAIKLSEDNVALRAIIHKIVTNVKETKQSLKLASGLTKFDLSGNGDVTEDELDGKSTLELSVEESVALKEQIQELVENIEKQKKAIIALEKEKNHVNEIMDKLDAELAAVSEECKQQREIVLLRDKEVEALKCRIESSTLQHGKMHNTAQTQEETVKHLTADLTLANVQLENMQRVYNELQKQLKSCQDKYEVQIEEEKLVNKQLVQKIAGLERRLERYERRKDSDADYNVDSSYCLSCKQFQSDLKNAKERECQLVKENSELQSDLTFTEKKLGDCDKQLKLLEEHIAVLDDPHSEPLAERIINLQHQLNHNQNILTQCIALCQHYVDTIEKAPRSELRKALLNVMRCCQNAHERSNIKDSSREILPIVARKLAVEAAILMELLPLIEVHSDSEEVKCLAEIRKVLRLCALTKNSLSAVVKHDESMLTDCGKLANLMEEKLALEDYVNDSCLKTYQNNRDGAFSYSTNFSNPLIKICAKKIFYSTIGLCSQNAEINTNELYDPKCSCITELSASCGTDELSFLLDQLQEQMENHNSVVDAVSEKWKTKLDVCNERLNKEKDSFCCHIDLLIDEITGKLTDRCAKLEIINLNEVICTELRAFVTAWCMQFIEQHGSMGSLDSKQELGKFLEKIDRGISFEIDNFRKKFDVNVLAANKDVANNADEPDNFTQEKRNFLYQLGYLFSRKIVLLEYISLIQSSLNKLLEKYPLSTHLDKHPAIVADEQSKAAVKKNITIKNLELLGRAKLHLATVAEKRLKGGKGKQEVTENDLFQLVQCCTLTENDLNLASAVFPDLDMESNILQQAVMSASICYIKETLRAKYASTMQEHLASLQDNSQIASEKFRCHQCGSNSQSVSDAQVLKF